MAIKAFCPAIDENLNFIPAILIWNLSKKRTATLEIVPQISKIRYRYGSENWQELEADNYELKAFMSGKELFISLYIQGLDTQVVNVELPFTYQSDFDNHVKTKINEPNSHSYEPHVFVTSFLSEQQNNYQLTTRVQVDLEFDQDTISLPKYDGTINIDGSYANNFLYLTIATPTDTDTAEIYLPLDEEITILLLPYLLSKYLKLIETNHLC